MSSRAPGGVARAFNLIAVCLALTFPLSAAVSFAQTLPPPSRTIYKCEVGGRIVYSDDPCLGAQKLEVEPTRGLNKQTGRVREGRDVRAEHQRENMAKAVRPLTGLDAKQMGTLSRRMKLAPEVQRECRLLDIDIPRAEGEERERRARGETLGPIQTRLYALRHRSRDLGC